MQYRKRGLVILLGVVLTLEVGCASVPKRHPLPLSQVDRAVIAGIPHARSWGDELPEFADTWFAMEREEIQKAYSAWFGKHQAYLAISGGGAKGAFGAGLLVGWTDSGTRPEFQLVTGISTGALTAPFAFLGSDYDGLLEEVYTQYATKDLVNKRGFFNAMTSDAMYSTKKLEALIARYFDEEILEKLAVEAAKGRVLNIGTTNLDAGRPVIWRISAIAASDRPDRLELIRKIILASASIPAAFPPVAIEVESDGQPFDELHVDGGASAQVFLYPAAIDGARIAKLLDAPDTPEVFVIRNSWVDPENETVNRKLFPIVGRTVDSLIRTQGIGDLYRIYLLTQRDGLDFNLAYLPETFTDEPEEAFDPAWMRKLFDIGYEMGKAGYPWSKTPPDYGEQR